MTFKIEFRDDAVLEWQATSESVTSGGAEVREVEDYTPTIYATAESETALDELTQWATTRWDVVDSRHERRRPAFRRDPEAVLRLDVASIDRVRPLAGSIRRLERPGTYRLFNVDFSPQFRYCLEREIDPVPDQDLSVLELSAPAHHTPTEPLTHLEIGNETVESEPTEVLATLQETLERIDPDVLVLSSGELVPALFATAEEAAFEFSLGRRPGYEQLASASTYESYGQVGHSPARYDVPGRVVIDRTNTFFYDETNLGGCLDLVERSRKPLQELSWASIGNVLTAIQIREAGRRNVLVPWKSWRHEFPKTMAQLHEGDRGGFTFSPEVGVHEDVHELDFSSLYPNIICTHNISPETIRCDCHERADVPGLGYSICDEPGYLPGVLQPIIDDRDELKAAIEETDDPERKDALEGKSAALKWILVSCFGYQGFSNAKFGRIECHEAINAFAREILLDAKTQLEGAGWRVVHGIVDSLWVTAREDAEQAPLDSVARDVTDCTGITLEYEAAYDWIAFVPCRSGESGALTKYFGRRRDGSDKYRGLECRQRSTAPFVADCQRTLIETFDATRSPEAVCGELSSWVSQLETGGVDPSRLTITKRTSKDIEEYEHETRTTAALRRRRDEGDSHFPGQDVQYIVVDDEKRGRERVALAREVATDPSENSDSSADYDGYDTEFYREQLVRAAESVLSPVGWRSQEIESELADREDLTLGSFSG